MKWSLQQLYRLGKQPFNFSGEYDFKDRIKDIDDILDISIVNVEGFGQNINEDQSIKYLWNWKDRSKRESD